MNNHNKKYLWNLIQSTGDCLLNKLPDNPNHPKGRNSYAHGALKVITKFGSSYKELPDDKFEEVIEYLKSIKNPEG